MAKSLSASRAKGIASSEAGARRKSARLVARRSKPNDTAVQKTKKKHRMNTAVQKTKKKHHLLKGRSTKKPPLEFEDWNYDVTDKSKGPTGWPMVDGHAQSPIDLKMSRAKTIQLTQNERLKFHLYDSEIHGEFVNTGKSLQFRPDINAIVPVISGGLLDQPYRFVQYHYHWSEDENKGSEHAIDGRFYAAELHLVHEGVNDASKLAVLGVFLEANASASAAEFNADLAALRMVQECGQHTPAGGQRLADKLLASSPFARYSGSLTTPPCTENVTWTLFTQPKILARDALQQLISQLRTLNGNKGSKISANCRPIQKLHHRKVFKIFE